jgi:hypothetical protein
MKLSRVMSSAMSNCDVTRWLENRPAPGMGSRCCSDVAWWPGHALGGQPRWRVGDRHALSSPSRPRSAVSWSARWRAWRWLASRRGERR